MPTPQSMNENLTSEGVTDGETDRISAHNTDYTTAVLFRHEQMVNRIKNKTKS